MIWASASQGPLYMISTGSVQFNVSLNTCKQPWLTALTYSCRQQTSLGIQPSLACGSACQSSTHDIPKKRKDYLLILPERCLHTLRVAQAWLRRTVPPLGMTIPRFRCPMSFCNLCTTRLTHAMPPSQVYLLCVWVSVLLRAACWKGLERGTEAMQF